MAHTKILAILLLSWSIAVASGLQCVICNSQVDPGCVEGDSKYSVDCTKGRNTSSGSIQVPNAKTCWKQAQTLDISWDSTLEIIDRTCGADPIDNHRCYDRKGTKGLKVTYCSCDQDGCNSGNWNYASKYGVAIAVIAAAVLMRMF